MADIILFYTSQIHLNLHIISALGQKNEYQEKNSTLVKKNSLKFDMPLAACLSPVMSKYFYQEFTSFSVAIYNHYLGNI